MFSWEVARDLPTMCVCVCFFLNISFAYFVGVFIIIKNMRSSCLEEFVKPLRFCVPFLTTSADSSCQVESCSKRGKLGSNT